MPSSVETADHLKDALSLLQPAGVFSAVEHADAREAFPYPDEGRHLAGAAPRRKQEFISGRSCARKALVSLGVEPCPIRSDGDGVPVWPEQCVGSISHSRGLCAAVAGSGQAFTCLGLDLEKTNRLSPAAAKRVVHPDEASWVRGDQARASLLFSAKEAFYKAQFPKWRCPGSFHDLVLSVDETKGAAHVESIARSFPAALRERAEHFRFQYRFFDDYVVSLCWLRAS